MGKQRGTGGTALQEYIAGQADSKKRTEYLFSFPDTVRQAKGKKELIVINGYFPAVM